MAISGGKSFVSGAGDTVGAKLSNDGLSVVLVGDKGGGEVDYTLTPAETMKIMQLLGILEQAAKLN